MIMNITATQITPERKQELVEQLVDLLSSRYDAGNLYDILRHGLGMDHSDTVRLRQSGEREQPVLADDGACSHDTR